MIACDYEWQKKLPQTNNVLSQRAKITAVTSSADTNTVFQREMSVPDSSYSGSHIATPIFANNVTWSCSGCISFARANISTHVAHTSCLPNLHAGEMLGQIAQPERQVGTQLQVLQNVVFLHILS